MAEHAKVEVAVILVTVVNGGVVTVQEPKALGVKCKQGLVAI